MILYDKKIEKYGHEYLLVVVPIIDGRVTPSFMGCKGYALKAVRKIVKK